MTDHTWAQGAADCAVARAWQHTWGTDRYQREFTTFGDLAVMAWRWENHPIYPPAIAAT
jgi:hypothetical protein